MRKVLLLALCLVVAFAANAQKTSDKKKNDKTGMPVVQAHVVISSPVVNMPKLANAKDSASYAYGLVLGASVKRQMNTELNSDLIVQALNASIKNDATLFTTEQASAIYGDYNKMMQMKAGEAAEQFLEKNKKRPEVKTTASGLQYEVLKAGDPNNPMPLATDKVKVHYHGTLIDGVVFDSSVDRGKPAEFGLNQVIKGWTEGVQLMHVGDKFKFFLPYQLAYGERGSGQKIKPYAALVFEVELLEILAK
jgi:FKBP-type peptidyl-prolyl cis-trans isomerase FklB